MWCWFDKEAQTNLVSPTCFFQCFPIVTKFGKTCIVHTFNFSTLVTCKNYLEYIDGCETFGNCRTTIPLTFWKFQICILFLVAFMDLQMSKIGCVNYACFLRSVKLCWCTWHNLPTSIRNYHTSVITHKQYLASIAHVLENNLQLIWDVSKYVGEHECECKPSSEQYHRW